MKIKILKIIANLALLGVFIGICISEMSLGAKIIWCGSLTILICVLEMIE